MGKRSTFAGYIRQRGSSNPSGAGRTGGTPGTFKCFVQVAFDPTAAAAGTGVYLPAGAVPLGVTTLGGATGGASPTVDLQLAGGTAAGLANELDADTASAVEVQTGADLGVALTANTEIEAGVGASAATGGTTTALVSYIIADDGVLND
jgi:hypothetical protein